MRSKLGCEHVEVSFALLVALAIALLSPCTSPEMATWSKEETLRLIEIWGDDRIQAQLEGTHRNKDVYTKIAREMSEAGFERTFQQCRDKLKNLRVSIENLKINREGQEKVD